MSWIAPVQPLLLGIVLLWSARFKLLNRQVEAEARRTALAQLLGERRALPAYLAVGVIEALLGALLLAPPALPVEAGATAALAVGFGAYLGYARIAAPASSCGCMSATRTPIRWRAFARAAALVVMSLVAMPATATWLSVFADRPVSAAMLVVAELAVIVALSAELDRFWLDPLRQLWVRLTHPLPTGSFDVPLASTVEQLHHSTVYRDAADLLSSDVREHWDEDQWRILVYSARYDGRDASAVFAVPRLRYEPDAVRVAVVDEQTNETLLSLAGSPTG